jgi:hypothetical protein
MDQMMMDEFLLETMQEQMLMKELINELNKTKYSDIKLITKDEKGLKYKILMKSEMDILELNKYLYNNMRLESEHDDTYFEFFLEHKSIFFKLYYEYKMIIEPMRCMNSYIEKPAEVPDKRFLQAYKIEHLMKRLGLQTTWGKYEYPDARRGPMHLEIEESDIEEFRKAECDTVKKYRSMCDILDLAPNKKNRVDNVKETITFINNILKKYSISKIVKEVKRLQIDGKRYRFYKYHLTITMDFDPTLFIINNSKNVK